MRTALGRIGEISDGRRKVETLYMDKWTGEYVLEMKNN